ncbi:hypothetical protein GCM10011495_25500 [Hymenobacter frigidus]|uniref:Outer membrane protein beta-barrel domain-containing protein n=1 Tax=Hymenobacter frigidus TaxID=1524095 RepID=A0ABQ2AA16_9BACT|nr:hypothetical protein [Hymenobacter frigidus]GGH87184.1 hypothetical protein GCM10011495_25500 [Hymenobacter frigidus]
MNYLRLTAFLLLLLPGLAASAQSKKKSGGSSSGSGSGYSTGIGLRGGGYSSGLTIKHFLSGKNGVAIEGLLTTEYKARGARLTILGEKHIGVPDAKGLQFYYGAGFHAGAYQGRYYFADDRFYYKGRDGDKYFVKNNRNGYFYDEATYIAFGADLILGLEYKLPDLPFVVGVDYKPFFEVYNGYNGFYNDAAVSLRYTF